MMWTRTLRTGAIALVAALATAGCIKSDQKTAIAKDGSGTLDMKMSFDVSKMKEMTEMFKGMMPQPEAPPAMTGEPAMEGDPAMGEEKKKEDDGFSKNFSKEEVEKQLKKTEGNELKEYTAENTDAKQTVHMVVAFKSFENLCKTGVMGNLAVTLVKNEDGSYAMTLDAKGGQGAGAGGGDAGGMDMSAMAPMLEPFLGGMEFKTELTIPGTVVETNGTKSEDGTKVNWTVDWKALSGADKDKKDATKMTVSFKGDGIELKAFSFKPDAEAAAGKMGFGPK